MTDSGRRSSCPYWGGAPPSEDTPGHSSPGHLKSEMKGWHDCDGFHMRQGYVWYLHKKIRGLEGQIPGIFASPVFPRSFPLTSLGRKDLAPANASRARSKSLWVCVCASCVYMCIYVLEHKTCEILAAERLRLIRFDNRLIIDSLKVVYCSGVRKRKTSILWQKTMRMQDVLKILGFIW